MWITTVTYDLAAMRAMEDAERDSMLASIKQKKNELKIIDEAGAATAEHPEPVNTADIPLSDNTTIIKRAWNQETNAQAFVDHFAAFGCVTVTLEEQI